MNRRYIESYDDTDTDDSTPQRSRRPRGGASRKRRSSDDSNSKLRKEPSKAWTQQETDYLVSVVAATSSSMESIDWQVVSQQLAGRTGKQCREKWKNDLRPNINKEPWSLKEEYVLALAHYQYGNRWSEVAHYLPTRPENTIKNRWWVAGGSGMGGDLWGQFDLQPPTPRGGGGGQQQQYQQLQPQQQQQLQHRHRQQQRDQAHAHRLEQDMLHSLQQQQQSHAATAPPQMHHAPPVPRAYPHPVVTTTTVTSLPPQAQAQAQGQAHGGAQHRPHSSGHGFPAQQHQQGLTQPSAQQEARGPPLGHPYAHLMAPHSGLAYPQQLQARDSDSHQLPLQLPGPPRGSLPLPPMPAPLQQQQQPGQQQQLHDMEQQQARRLPPPHPASVYGYGPSPPYGSPVRQSPSGKHGMPQPYAGALPQPGAPYGAGGLPYMVPMAVRSGGGLYKTAGAGRPGAPMAPEMLPYPLYGMPPGPPPHAQPAVYMDPGQHYARQPHPQQQLPLPLGSAGGAVHGPAHLAAQRGPPPPSYMYDHAPGMPYGMQLQHRQQLAPVKTEPLMYGNMDAANTVAPIPGGACAGTPPAGGGGAPPRAALGSSTPPAFPAPVAAVAAATSPVPVMGRMYSGPLQ
ncbi:Myb-related protein 3R-1 [Tetrabaena socialis]|uniref:Myb-related protein 3R-1 n=1 Tax=Tetrabaena socialis TaxID=47790 RepID=A0A2J7ZNM9_9CHLO|nr:Myb-related protein 3R-1 [Tetrabaena socialis]|eukprot:PNH01884.1 Myb-related protein 3R-1 [Tetrabaena socialis]